MALLVNPRQTVVVTCRSNVSIMGKDTEKDNAITLDWHMPVSFTPQLYAISVGKSRFSHKLIQEGKAYVVNFMPYEMKDAVLYIGRHTGEHGNKFKEANVEVEEAENVDCFKIKGCIGHLECEVIEEIDAGDHTIFIGKVVNTSLIKDKKRLFHTDGNDFTTTR